MHPPCNRRFAAALKLAAWSFIASLAAGNLAAAPSPTPSPFEQFKRFIAEPPVVEEILFREKLPPDPSAGRALDGSFSKSLFFNYYQARSQSNALFFRQMTGFEDAGNRTVQLQLFSRFGERHWLVDRTPNPIES